MKVPPKEAAMKKDEIIVIYGRRIMEMAREACRLAGLKDMILQQCGSYDAMIALKPNLLGPIPAESGATTHPEIAEGVIRYLRENSFHNISVMEGSWVGDRTEDSLLVCGYQDMLSRMDVPFIDLQKDQSIPVDCGGLRLRICQTPLKADFLINLPVMKGHCQTRMTCALKNMKGCIPNSEKRRFHQMGLFDPIGHLSLGIRQNFILTDSICSDLTFEDGGNPVQQNRIFACADPVLNDAFCCSLMGLSVSDVPYIGIAKKCGAGSDDLTRACVRTFREKTPERNAVTYEEGQEDADAAAAGQDRKMADLIYVKEIVNDVDSCSACYGTLVPVLKRLMEEGHPVERLRGICIGQGYRKKTGRLGIGNCTSCFEKSLPGCPPGEEEMYLFLKKQMET